MIAESAFNDPTGAILALAVAGVVRTGDVSITGEVGDFLRDLVLSTALGVVIGFALALAISAALGDGGVAGDRGAAGGLGRLLLSRSTAAAIWARSSPG